MIYKRSKMLALLLSFMMIALNMFTGVGPMYSYAETESDSQPAAELAGDKDQADADQTNNDQLDKEQTEDTSMAKGAEETALPGEEAESAHGEAAEGTASEVSEEVHGDAAEESATEVSEEAQGEEAPEEAGEVAFDRSKTVDGVKVRVSADGGVFPEGSTLKVKKLSGETKAEAEAAVHEETSEGDIAKEYLFDITILDKEGNEIQPEGKANVSFETSEVADQTLQANVYHIKDNGKAEALDVDVNGEIARVETTGFSAYTLIFSYTNPSTGTTKSINLPIGAGSASSAEIAALVSEIGLSQYDHGQVEYAKSSDPSIVEVYTLPEIGTWYLRALAPTENEVHLTLRFKDGYEEEVLVTSHKHHWKATGDNTNAVTIFCEDTQNCYYFNNIYFDDKGFTAQIYAEDATYDGNPHGAEKKLQQRFPQRDVTVEKDIHYVGIEDTTYEDSTTAPTDAGKYKAYYQIEPQGQDDVFTVQTEYTIKKADINFDPAPAAVSNLTYNGEDQELYTLGNAKSTTASETFPIKYWYDGDDTNKVEDQVLKGKDVGAVKIRYQAEGDANHNDTEVKTIDIKIGKRPVKVSGITAGNKTYDGTTKATLNYDNAEFADILEGDTLTVSAKGTFADKNAGDNKTVNITGMTLGGADVDKYTLATSGQQESTTANIAAKTLKVKWQESDELPYTGEEQAPKAEFEFAQDLSTDDGKAYTGDDVQPVISGKHKDLAVWTARVDSLSGEDAANYKLDPVSSNVNKEYKIVPKKITVDWKVIKREYDAKALEPDYTLDGFVGGDQPNKHIAFTADPTELVGNQAVNAGSYKATLELTGDTAKHYEITNPETKFTITKAPLSIYAEGWIYYGDKVESKDDIHGIKFDKDKCEGFKGDDGVGVLKGDADITTDYKFKDNATGVNGAKYNLHPQNVEAANYNITETNGELTVYPKPVVLEWTREHEGTETAVSGKQALTYDGKEYKFTAKVSEASYVKPSEGQQADEITVETYDGNVQKNSNAKTMTDKYTAEAMTLSNPNYALKDKEGKVIDRKTVDFTIAQLPIQFDWAIDTFTYNGKDQTVKANISNLAQGDGDPLAYEGQTEKDAGDYTAKITGVVDANYTIKAEDESKMEKKWTIKPLPVKLTWTNGNKVYNGKDQSVWADVSNVVTGDQLMLTYADNTKKAAGSYTARVTEIDNPNYTLDGATGLNMEWKIGKRAGTVGTPRLTNVAANSSKKTNTGSWRTVSGAKGYEFAWKTRTAKKFTTMKVGRKSYAVAPRMVSKGLYEYKVRAIKGETSTDKAITGKWSNSLYRYYFTLQKIRLKNEKGGFTVSWQRDSYATGYQVMYSTNKKGTNPKIITMSGNSVTKRTVKGLKKGTVYYVQIRAIKKVGRINYMGNISNPKPVKAF